MNFSILSALAAVFSSILYSCFYHGKCGKAAIYRLDTPILGEECKDLLSLPILASFDTLSSHENGIFTIQRQVKCQRLAYSSFRENANLTYEKGVKTCQNS